MLSVSHHEMDCNWKIKIAKKGKIQKSAQKLTHEFLFEKKTGRTV
jgi:hypothetical protein